jgi:hypothetical protein
MEAPIMKARNFQMTRRMCLWAGVVCSVLILLPGCSRNKASDEEQKALAAFQAVQQSLETDGASVALSQLLGQAEAKLSLIKQTPKTIPCLVSSLDRCLATYRLIDKALKAKQEAPDEKRKQDLEMALAFSTAFSALNIQQAMDCCR